MQNYQSDDGITNGKHNVVNLFSSIKADDQISAFALDSEGNKTGYWTKLDDETWTYTFFVYKANVPWRIYEDSLSGYSGNYTNASPLNITDGSSEAVITNTSDKISAQKYGSLKITKRLSSGTSNIKFSFEVSLTDENGNALSGNSVFGGIPFSDGKATLSLKAGESVGISGIPVGYHYKIKELPTAGYRQESFSNSAGVIPEGEADAICANKLAPNRETPSNPDAPKETVLVVINKICSSQSDRFKFWINISGLTAEENVEVRVKTTASDTEKTVSYSPDSSGEINAEADISGGGSITLSNVPVGAEYQITEQPSSYLASYKITDENAKALAKNKTVANTSVNTALSTFKETADSGEAVIITYINEKPKYPVSFTKRDDKDDFVEGALLEVLSSDGKSISSWTTAAGESMKLMLEPGDYTLKETSAPSGYVKAADIAFSVSDDGNVISGGTEIPDSEIEMIDSRTELSVQISKVDASGYPLPGAALKISDISGASIDTWTSDNKPHEVKLSFGQSYVLSEVSAPAGYEKAADIRISVSADGTLSVDGKASSIASVEMVDTRKTYILPSTGGGGNNLHLLIFAVSASLFAAGVLLSKTGRGKTS